METKNQSTSKSPSLDERSFIGNTSMPIMAGHSFAQKTVVKDNNQYPVILPGSTPGIDPMSKIMQTYIGTGHKPGASPFRNKQSITAAGTSLKPGIKTGHKIKTITRAGNKPLTIPLYQKQMATVTGAGKEPDFSAAHKKVKRTGAGNKPLTVPLHTKQIITEIGSSQEPSQITRYKNGMMIMKKQGKKPSLNILVLVLILLAALFTSCKKSFLDEKPNKAQLIPTTLSDFQKLLDNTYVMNMSPSLTLIAGDEFYSDAASVAAYSTPQQRNAYTWEKDIYEGRSNPDWSISYSRIFYANIVLEGLEKSTANEQASVLWKTIKGSALFYRAFAYHQLAQIFCAAYQPSTVASALGLPLKLTADINDLPQRSNLEQTYGQILADLDQALELLPLSVSYKNRPSKTACLALLSRVYLSMGNYDQAEKYATESLGINAKLTDFNTLTATLTSSANPFPAAFPTGNEEVQYWETLYAYNFLSSTLIVDSTLYRSYAANDLRKPVYFVDRGNGVINYKGYFGGSSGGFFGLANDELLLTRAECRARKGLTAEALTDLNTLLRSRWKTGTFVNFTAADAKAALDLVLKERRKSLFRRGIRWTDLKRLNLDPSYQVTLVKILGGQHYTLPPNDPRYVFPIPDDEIRGSGIEQNPR